MEEFLLCDNFFDMKKIKRGKRIILNPNPTSVVDGRYEDLEFSGQKEFDSYMDEKYLIVNTLFSKQIKSKTICDDTLNYYVGYFILFDMVENLNVFMYNRKGGVGKTLFTFLISKSFGYHVDDLDATNANWVRLDDVSVYGHKASGSVMDLSKYEVPEEGRNIVDFKGDKYHNESQYFQMCDVLVCPTSVMSDVTKTTDLMLSDLKEFDGQLLFAFNKVKKHSRDRKNKQTIEKIQQNFNSHKDSLGLTANMTVFNESDRVEELLEEESDILDVALNGKQLQGQNAKTLAIATVDFYIEIIKTAQGKKQ